MEIKADFYSDFMKLSLDMIAVIKKQGFRFEEYEDWKKRESKTNTAILSAKKSSIEETALISAYEKALVSDFANWKERIPDPVPRIIYKCSGFSCPKQYQEGLAQLERTIKNGDNLMPYLSRDIYDARKNDRMLFILGITHFHLGTKQDGKKPLLIKGTEDILYAFLQKQDCYFIKIDKHGLWDDENLLRLVNSDFPDVLKPWKLKDVTPGGLSDNDRKILRSKNVITLITINNDVYMPPGWGTSTAGTSVKATFDLVGYIHYLDILEKKLILQLNEQKEKIEKDYGLTIERMDLFLYQTDPVKIFDKKNSLSIVINSFDGNNLSIKIRKYTSVS